MADFHSLEGIFRKIDLGGFHTLIPDEATALGMIAGEKWQEGYKCRKCGHDNYCAGKTPFSRRCTRCKHEESATAHTLFHRCKISLKEAMEIAYMICRQPEISSYEISRKVEIRQMTCWKFKKKIEACLREKGRLALVP